MAKINIKVRKHSRRSGKKDPIGDYIVKMEHYKKTKGESRVIDFRIASNGLGSHDNPAYYGAELEEIPEFAFIAPSIEKAREKVSESKRRFINLLTAYMHKDSNKNYLSSTLDRGAVEVGKMLYAETIDYIMEDKYQVPQRYKLNSDGRPTKQYDPSRNPGLHAKSPYNLIVTGALLDAITVDVRNPKTQKNILTIGG